MKPIPALKAERAIAQHCAELLRPAAPEREVSECAAEFGDALGKALREPLASLLGGSRLQIACGEPETLVTNVLSTRFDAPSAHFLIDGLVARGGLTISLTREAALSLCDRAFGGTGRDLPDAASTAFTTSDDLMLENFGELVAAALARTCKREAEDLAIRRGKDLGKLVPFGCNAECLSLTLIVREEEREDWHIRLTGLAVGFSDWLAGFDKPAPAKSASGSPADAPFCDIPLALNAVLTEFRLPAGRIAALAPGDCLPLTLRGDARLLLAGRAIAAGQVGSMDEAVALKLTKIISAQGSFA